MKYKKPALIEQFAEIHFETQSFDQARIIDIVSDIKKQGFENIEITRLENISLNTATKTVTQSPIPRIMCWDKSKVDLIQVSPDFLAINKVKHYSGWDNFLKTVKIAYDTTCKKLANCKIRSLSLVTIDHFTIQDTKFKAGDILNCGGNKIPEWYADCSGAFDISLGRGQLNIDKYNRQVQIRCQRLAEHWNISINSIFHNFLENNDVYSLLEQLHEESNTSFESMITDYTRNTLMGGAI